MKFSSSRSKEEARFLKELALSLINWKSVSAESLTPRHPLEMKEKALVEFLLCAARRTRGFLVLRRRRYPTLSDSEIKATDLRLSQTQVCVTQSQTLRFCLYLIYLFYKSSFGYFAGLIHNFVLLLFLDSECRYSVELEYTLSDLIFALFNFCLLIYSIDAYTT